MNFNKEQIIDIIRTRYSHLSEQCKTDFKDLSKVLAFDKSAMLVQEGQYADKTYFILQGCARAFYLKDGKDITDWFAFENDFMCSANSFFLRIPSPHYIEVLEQTTLLEIARENMTKLCDKHHDFDRLGRIAATKTMLQLQQRIVSVQSETLWVKFLRRLLKPKK